VNRRELSDAELVAGMIATASEVSSTLPDATNGANGWVAARTLNAGLQRERVEALARATRAENEARLLRTRATRAELECELLRVRLARLREQWKDSTLGLEQETESRPRRDDQRAAEEPSAADALRSWLQRRTIANIDKDGAA
jgi:hypothetical protein